MAAVDGFEPSFFVSKTNELTIIRNRFFHNKPQIEQKSNSRFPAMRQICVLRRSRMNPNNSSERIAKRNAGDGRRERGRFLQTFRNHYIPGNNQRRNKHVSNVTNTFFMAFWG